jgi:exodeoxyribonuclease V alpha subunit
VERVTFHNPDNGFCVLRVKVKGHHELVTLLGAAPSSEHPAVVIPLTTQHYLMLRRKLVYTAITRAKQLAVLIGQRRALAIAVQDSHAQTRWSKLKQWLRCSGLSKDST